MSSMTDSYQPRRFDGHRDRQTRRLWLLQPVMVLTKKGGKLQQGVCCFVLLYRYWGIVMYGHGASW